MTAPPSPALPPGFAFVAEPAAYRDPAALVVRIPGRVRSKKKLLAILTQKLRLPGYFGWNWDALDECLRDLSWLTAPRIVLVHDDVPFGPGGAHRATYVSILQAAATTPASRLTVVWPESARCDVASAVDADSAR